MCGAQFFQRFRLGAVVVALAAAIAAAPAHADVEVANAEITIVRPLSFVIDDNLDFGALIPGTVAGTVVMTPTSVRTVTGGIVLVGAGHKAASFAGQGTFNQRVDVSLASNSIFITGPGAPMRVRDFTIGSTPTAVLTTNPRRFRIGSASGVFSFPIGATLEVGANQAAGTYIGNWTITLNYF